MKLLVQAADRAYVRPRNSPGLRAVVMDQADFEALKDAEVFVTYSGLVKVRFAGWPRSKLLDEHLLGKRCQHKNNDLLDFRRCNLEPL
jgi:hypothetical protein